MLEKIVEQRRSIFYGHTDQVYITILLQEGPLEYVRFNNIDELHNYPDAKVILIAGLKQKDFEYFVENFADKFEVIHFWKCPYVSDLSALGELRNVKYITYYWNRRADKLWDFSKNESLLGLEFHCFSNVKSLDGIQNS